MKRVQHNSRMALITSALALAVLGTPALAAPPVDAGRSLQELQTPTAPSAQPVVPAPITVPELSTGDQAPEGSLLIATIHITGNTVIAGDTLHALVQSLEGSEVSLTELQAATQRITALYRQQGYLVARAYLPQQQVTQGQVTIAVLEGVLSEAYVNNESRVSDRQVNGIMQSNLSVGEPLKMAEANRALLLLHSMPGIEQAKGGLRPGAEMGSTALDVTTTAERRANGLLRVDNYGNQYTGRGRLTGLVNLPNLLGMGDELSVQGVISEDDGVDYARLAWDAPVGYRGVRLGASASNTRYELGKEYRALDAYGDATTLALYGSYPIVLAPSQHLNIGLSLEQRQLRDKMAKGLQNNNEKKAQAAVITLDGDRHDGLLGGGANAFRLSATFGDLSMDSRDAKLADSVLKTEGSYSKIALSATRLQQLPAKFSLFVAGNVQWASKNLDSSEALFLGGANGIRAYPQGEGAGDEGWMLNVELRYAVLSALRLKLFHDEGEVAFNKKPKGIAGSNHQHIGGTGVGLDAQWRQLSAGVAAAWRSTDKPQADKDDKPRVWGQVTWQF